MDLLRANRKDEYGYEKRSFKKLITLSLTLAMLTGVAGCGKQQSLNAETNPDTPVSDVQFPLKEKAELSFITSAPPHPHRILMRGLSSREWRSRPTCISTGHASFQTSSLTRRIWHWRSLVICRMDCLMQV